MTEQKVFNVFVSRETLYKGMAHRKKIYIIFSSLNKVSAVAAVTASFHLLCLKASCSFPFADFFLYYELFLYSVLCRATFSFCSLSLVNFPFSRNSFSNVFCTHAKWWNGAFKLFVARNNNNNNNKKNRANSTNLFSHQYKQTFNIALHIYGFLKRWSHRQKPWCTYTQCKFIRKSLAAFSEMDGCAKFYHIVFPSSFSFSFLASTITALTLMDLYHLIWWAFLGLLQANKNRRRKKNST